MSTMRRKIAWPLCLAGLGCVVALLMIGKRTATVTGERGVEVEGSRSPVHFDATPAESPSAPIPTPVERQEVIPEVQTVSQPPQRPAAAEPTFEHSVFTDPAAREELGRLALSYVGADPLADEIWVWLINDSELSAKVREDLIEDLNENGFSDGNGRRATVDDLPLIESRILLLEENAQFAMDDVNAAAFAEAYKDLANMWRRLNQ